MCGICGVINRTKPVKKETIQKMCALLKHRGPDEEGFYMSNEIGLGHVRLSIIDLSSGQQPIFNEDKTKCIIFNGEIYNYQELEPDLKRKGHIFTTKSDTEVILHLYEDLGPKCLEHLRGMFAFAIYDLEKKEIFLARDRVGKKPLFYSINREAFAFASELKSILINPDFEREIDYTSIYKYLSYSWIPAPNTIMKNVFKLEPGNYLKYDFHEHKYKIEKYWELGYDKKNNHSEKEAIENIKYLFNESVKIRLHSDVPLGCLLSGGIDSAAVTSYMRRNIEGDLHTFTIGFDEKEYSEIENARIISNKFNTNHEEYIVKPDAIKILPKLVWYFDEPFGDSSAIPSYYVSKIARKKVKVILNGDGGDESFFGYTRYLPLDEKDVMSKWCKIPERIRKTIIHPIAFSLLKMTNFNKTYRRMYFGNQYSFKKCIERYILDCRMFKDEVLEQFVLEPKIIENPLSDIYMERYNSHKIDKKLNLQEQMLMLDNMLYLPNDLLVKMDRMTMANSLEGRSPFLDHKLMEYVASLPLSLKFPDNNLKYLLKKALTGNIPDQILFGPKKGFTVPISKWFKNELNDFCFEILNDRKTKQRGIFDIKFINKLLNEHKLGYRGHHQRLWSLINLELWFRTFYDRSFSATGPISL
jgi:asparagine synthase (glutamine-hydrolysing)